MGSPFLLEKRHVIRRSTNRMAKKRTRIDCPHCGRETSVPLRRGKIIPTNETHHVKRCVGCGRKISVSARTRVAA
jgi:hypothetical protein